MRRILLGSAAVAAAFAVVPMTSATAEGCGVPDDSTYKTIGHNPSLITIGFGKANDGSLYIDDRDFPTGNGLWIYQEANNADSLQRGGTSIMGADLGGADPCTEADVPDQVIF